MVNLEVKGYKEAKEILDELPNAMQKKMLLSSLKATAKPSLNSAKQKAPYRSGTLKKTLKVVRFKDRQAPKSEVDVAVKSVFSRTAKKKLANEYYGKFVHEGTKDPRRPRHAKALVFIGRNGEKVFAKSVKGLKARPYLEQAYSETGEKMVTDFGDNLARSVEKFVAKNFKKIEK